MKNLIFLMLLSININAQEIPNLTTEFSDIPEDILLWEMNEGDVALYKYSRFHLRAPLSEIETMDEVMYVKLFFSEDRRKLYNVITVIAVDDELYQADYTIFLDRQDVKMIDGKIEFTGTNSNDLFSTIVLIPGKGDLLTVYVGVNHDEGTYSTYCVGVDLISKVWYEDVIKSAKQEDWNLHYDFD